MDQNLFAAVDHYIEELFVPADPVLEATLQSIREAGLPQMQVSPTQGKLLYLLARLTQARRILEIGTLAGYSSIWLARALPADGRLITLEINSKHAFLAWSNLSKAGLADKVEVLTGPALETLPELEARQDEPFDLVFLDADKPNYTAYLEAVLRLTRPGSLILADNVIRGGNVLGPEASDASAWGVRAFNTVLAADPRLEAIVLQQVGVKGHDGLAIARVKTSEQRTVNSEQ